MKHYTGIGARATPGAILSIMESAAAALAQKAYTLRSGHAEGADSAFEGGAIQGGAGQTSEIYLPAPHWRGSNSSFHPGAIDPTLWRAAQTIAARHHPVWNRLKPFVQALHTRNVFQILGPGLNTPSRFVICWTPDGEASGGTGQALRIAEQYGVPIINLQQPAHLAHVCEQLALA